MYPCTYGLVSLYVMEAQMIVAGISITLSVVISLVVVCIKIYKARPGENLTRYYDLMLSIIGLGTVFWWVLFAINFLLRR